MHKVLDGEMVKPEMQPRSPVAKVAMLLKSNQAGDFSTRSLQVESTFPLAHDEEKVRRTPLCPLCSYVRMDVFMSKHEG